MGYFFEDGFVCGFKNVFSESLDSYKRPLNENVFFHLMLMMLNPFLQ